MLPILKKQTLLAFPEDARLRDKFSCVFSLEVLRSIEGAEVQLLDISLSFYCSRLLTYNITGLLCALYVCMYVYVSL